MAEGEVVGGRVVARVGGEEAEEGEGGVERVGRRQGAEEGEQGEAVEDGSKEGQGGGDVGKVGQDRARFSDLSMIDPLTTLLNRRGLEFQFHHMGSDCDTEHKHFVVMLDIDFFKLYNDHYGHQYGDIALKSIAQIIKEAVRTRDLAIRYGGEEFLLILRVASIWLVFID